MVIKYQYNFLYYSILLNYNLFIYTEELDKSIVYPFNNLQIDEADIELSFDIEQFNLLIDVKEIWCPENAIISYNDWIVKITKKLFETLQGFCKSLLPVAENKVNICKYNIMLYSLKY